jgi:putative transposase
MNEDRANIITWIDQAQAAGARQTRACEMIGISARTLQRWRHPNNDQDARQSAAHNPPNRLSELERQRIIEITNEPAYANLSPSKIVPLLADEGRYIASESSFYRILKAQNQLQHRQQSRPARQIKKPKALTATGPNQIYSWDITYLPSEVRGLFYYLYLVMDIYSRKIVGWQVYSEESSALAADLMKDICCRENIQRQQVILHSDNGSPMKGATMLATLQELGVVPSFSRPSVSNDNPYSESLFRTLKYRPEYPEKSFEDILSARHWVQEFVVWYNDEHLHSAIGFVTPSQRHRNEDEVILENRKKVYRLAKLERPERWSGDIRKWEYIKSVHLNPEKQKTESGCKKAA